MIVRDIPELLKLYVELHGNETKSAKAVGVIQQQFNAWRIGAEWPSEERTLKMAQAVGADPQHTLAVLRRDRAKSKDTRTVWQKIAEALAVVVLSAGVGAVGAPSPAEASSGAPSVYYVNRRKHWLSGLQAAM